MLFVYRYILLYKMVYNGMGLKRGLFTATFQAHFTCFFN